MVELGGVGIDESNGRGILLLAPKSGMPTIREGSGLRQEVSGPMIDSRGYTF
jgi:hypothetical protein